MAICFCLSLLPISSNLMSFVGDFFSIRSIFVGVDTVNLHLKA